MKIGSVPYLNARPLVDGLAHQPYPGVTLCYDTPSALIARLLAGELDIVMASTFSTFAHPSLRLLRGVGVTAAGAAWSVRLLSAAPPGEVRTLALDAASRSTNALARIVLADRYGARPECVTLPPDPAAMLARCDAAVLIGDIGITARGDGLVDLDLGAEWWALTELPFYFAGWVAREEEALRRAEALLTDSLAHGLRRLEAIADEEAMRLALPRDICFRYLTEVMRYHTGAAEEAGLAEFRARAQRLKLV